MEELILESAVKCFGFSVEELKGKSRKRELVWARALTVFFMKAYCGYTLAGIGYKIGERDHATIINLIEKVIDYVARYKDSKSDFMKLMKVIHEGCDNSNIISSEKVKVNIPEKTKRTEGKKEEKWNPGNLG